MRSARLRLGALFGLAALFGCGRTVTSDAGSGTGSTSEDDGVGSTGGGDTGGGSTGGGTDVPSSGPTTDTPGVTSTESDEWIEGDFEGLYSWYFEGVPSLSICGEERWACLEWNAAPYECGAIYLRVRGSLSPKGEYCAGHMGMTADYLLVVGEVLEARTCEAPDCNGDPPCDPQQDHCWTVHCDPSSQDCPDGTRCAMAPSKFEVLSSVTCVPLADPAKGLDDPCVMTVDESDRRVDDCGAGLQCWNEEPSATSGVCVQICWTDGPDSPCPGDCQVCPWTEYVGVCVPPDCGGAPCSTGTVCEWE